MTRFEIAMLANKLVKPATREMMWTRQKPADGSKDDYGLGWGTLKKYGLNPVEHDGSQQGTSTSITLAPEKRAGVVVLANMDDLDAMELSEQILKVALDFKDETK
jgi:CubicO group peptidase (beta-lactamase class C family)